jgi:hypothetical protein
MNGENRIRCLHPAPRLLFSTPRESGMVVAIHEGSRDAAARTRSHSSGSR